MLSVLATFSKSKSESFVIREFTKTLRDILFPYFLISLKQYFSIQDGYILVPTWPSNTDWMIQLESHAEWDKVLVNLFWFITQPSFKKDSVLETTSSPKYSLSCPKTAGQLLENRQRGLYFNFMVFNFYYFFNLFCFVFMYFTLSYYFTPFHQGWGNCWSMTQIFSHTHSVYLSMGTDSFSWSSVAKQNLNYSLLIQYNSSKEIILSGASVLCQEGKSIL